MTQGGKGRRRHIPNDPYNCTCHACVYAALVRMGGPWIASKTTRKQWV